MSKLEFLKRPLVAFDVANKQHRRWVNEFFENGTWGRCPVRFIVPDESGDLVTLVQQHLVRFYLDREFGKKEVDTEQELAYN